MDQVSESNPTVNSYAPFFPIPQVDFVPESFQQLSDKQDSSCNKLITPQFA